MSLKRSVKVGLKAGFSVTVPKGNDVWGPLTWNDVANPWDDIATRGEKLAAKD